MVYNVMLRVNLCCYSALSNARGYRELSYIINQWSFLIQEAGNLVAFGDQYGRIGLQWIAGTLSLLEGNVLTVNRSSVW